LIADPSGYIFTWLVGYSSLLCVGGIMIVDYYFIRKQQLELRICTMNTAFTDFQTDSTDARLPHYCWAFYPMSPDFYNHQGRGRRCFPGLGFGFVPLRVVCRVRYQRIDLLDFNER
jgi:hypothetical protein